MVFKSASQFSEKSNQKLPAAPVSIKVSALAISSLPRLPRQNKTLTASIATFKTLYFFVTKYFKVCPFYLINLAFNLLL
jgi:hypothetical protein